MWSFLVLLNIKSKRQCSYVILNKGTGVTPKYKINPVFALCKLECTPGTKVEKSITITNETDISISFQILRDYNKELKEVADDEEFQKNIPESLKKYDKPFENIVSNEILEFIEKNFILSSLPHLITFEPQTLTIQPHKKEVIKIMYKVPKLSTLKKTEEKLSTISNLSLIQKSEKTHSRESTDSILSTSKKTKEKHLKKLKIPKLSTKKESDKRLSKISKMPLQTKEGSRYFKRVNFKDIYKEYENLIPEYFVSKIYLTFGGLLQVCDWTIFGKIKKKIVPKRGSTATFINK